VLLGVWIDRSIYDGLETTAKSREIRVADVTRDMLAQSLETQRRRPDAEQILDSLLNLDEGEREVLRRQLRASSHNKALHLKALRASKTANADVQASSTSKGKSGT